MMSDTTEPTDDETLAAFFANLDVIAYSQPIVSATVKCKQIHLNDYRRSGLIAEGWEKNGRVAYTGRALLRAGIMAQLANALRPRDAAAYAQAFHNWFSVIKDGGDARWVERVARVHAVTVTHAGDPRLVEIDKPAHGKELWDRALNRPIEFAFEEVFREHPVVDEITIVLPVGTMVRQWALIAQRMLEGVYPVKSVYLHEAPIPASPRGS